MSPRFVDKDARKEQILRAALEVFAERGFEATSISQIADAAGISKGTIYLYFPSKSELTVAAAAAWVEAVEAGVTLPESGDPRARLRALYTASTNAFLNDPRVVLLFLSIIQLFLRDPSLRARFNVVREVSGPMREAIQQVLIDGAEQGLFRPSVAEQAERVAINVVAYLDGIGLHHVADPGFFDLTAQIELFLDGLLAGLRPTPEGT